MHPVTTGIPFYLPFVIAGFLLLPGIRLYAQRPTLSRTYHKPPSADSLSHIADSSVRSFFNDTQLLHTRVVVEPPRLFSKPLARFNGGYVHYDFSYRSNIDTPFAERNITQHTINGRFDFVAGNILPLTLNYFIRQSNSGLFRDLAEAQVQFDAAGFRQQLISRSQNRLSVLKPSAHDVHTEKLYRNKLNEWGHARDWLSSPFTIQKLQEYNEIIKVPAISRDMNLPDSVNNKKTDSLQRVAKQYIERYDSVKKQYKLLTSQTDSLKKEIDSVRSRNQEYKQLAAGKFNDWSSYKKWKNKAKEYQPEDSAVSNKYEWLMGIRNFSIGKTPVNYSELTVKNISITGINVEYNSWYYAAFAAGVVDYRFRDFAVNRFNRTPQHLVLARLGIGRVEHNYFIVTAYRGQKQLYVIDSNSSRAAAISVTGFSAETRWQVNKGTYITAEVAESLSPDYRATPAVEKGRFSLTGKTNKALSFKLYSLLPATSSVIEGMYKYTGANFQSFSSFQNNAAIQTWYLKWEQNFFQRKLRVTAALRSNEFTNPYIVQSYKSNTIFKSINAVFRTRKWPTVTLGYVPMSQLTAIGDQVIENRFQTLTASVNHFYPIGRLQAATAVMYNRFYNTGSDSGFIYYNAVNYYVTQHFAFAGVGVFVSLSHSRGNQYELNVMEENIRFRLTKRLTVDAGAKVNNLNNTETKLGTYGNASFIVTKKDIVNINYERGFLPGSNQHLLRSDMGSVQYSRMF